MSSFLNLSRSLSLYKRRDVQLALVAHAVDKEIAVKFGDGGFGKRPDILKYPNDVLDFAKRGASSFHCSEELWFAPLDIKTGSSKEDSNALRKGWDLVLDVDCPILDFSAIGADLLVNALNHYDISHVDVKFSGNHGFHLGVPFKSFPSIINDVEIKNWFPEGPRNIAGLLSDMIAPHLERKLLELYSAERIAEMTKTNLSDVWDGKSLDVSNIVKIDTVLIAPRHLYRMPYSLNEKSGLVSIPIDSKRILDFDKGTASVDNVVVDKTFLIDGKHCSNSVGDAKKLFIQALDYKFKEPLIQTKNFSGSAQDFSVSEAVNQEMFPPCMKLILLGLEDGRKRALFCMVNFLRTVGWSEESMKVLLHEWNQKNKPPLAPGTIDNQLKYAFQRGPVLPPNCDNKGYYIDFGVCKPDSFCAKIKNPANYSIIKWKISREEIKEKEEKNKKPDEIQVR